jgi:hypothetical protein
MNATRTDRTAEGPLHAEALQALRDAVWGVIQEHKRRGRALVVWRDGKVVEISPEEAEAEYLAAKARAEAQESASAPAGQTKNGA